MKNKTLPGAILLVTGPLIASIGWRLIPLVSMMTYTPVPSDRNSSGEYNLENVVVHHQVHAEGMLLFLAPLLFLVGPGMAITGAWLIRRDHIKRQERVIWQLLSGILQVIGVLIAGQYTLWIIAGLTECVSLGACHAGIVFVFVPLLPGVGLFFLGRMLYKPPSDPGPTDAEALPEDKTAESRTRQIKGMQGARGPQGRKHQTPPCPPEAKQTSSPIKPNV